MGRTISKHLRFLEKSQWWSLKELQEYQNKKLRQLIKHTYENVPYYHRIFRERNLKPDDIKTMEDLVKLPIIRRNDILNNFNNFKVKNFKKFKPIFNNTGGTTGKPLKYYRTKGSWSFSWASKYRSMGWGGYSYGNKLTTLGGSSLIPKKKKKNSKKIRYYIEKNLALSATHMSKNIMIEYSKKMKNFKPLFLRGYPSSITVFAKYILENNIDIRIKSVFTTAEVLFSNQREIIQKAFDCEVFDTYGCGDGEGNANECEVHNGLHISIENSIMEFINDNEPVSEGELGKIVLTSLHNYSFPFIRYTPDDMGIYSNENCSCKRGLPILKKIMGRTTDIIKFSNGRILGGPAITLIFKDFNIVEYQLVQEKRDFLVVKIVKDKRYLDNETQLILNIMKYHCGKGVEIRIDFIDEISKTKSSKYKFIISKVDN